MKKIVIAGTSVYGIENFGDEALLAVLCRELNEKAEDLEIMLLARHPGKDLEDFYSVKTFKNLEHDSKENSIGKWFYGLNPTDPQDHLSNVLKEIQSADLLILGGDPFSEISLGFYRGLMPHATLLITLAKAVQTPVMYYAVHMGRPILSEAGKEMTKFCVTNVDKITLREDFSETVLNEMGIETDNCVVLADGAFGLNPVEGKEQGMEILKRNGIEFKSDKVIGINFRHQYWTWTKEEWAHYRAMVVDICDYMIEEYGVDLLFIPNSTYEIDAKYQLYQDDRPTARDIYADLKNKEHAHKIEEKLDLYQTLTLFPLLDMHYSSRRHSLVFAALHGVPIIGSGAAGKWHIQPALEELSVGENFIPLDDLSIEKIKERIDATWNNRAHYSKILLEAIPPLRAKAIAHADVALEMLKKKSNSQGS